MPLVNAVDVHEEAKNACKTVPLQVASPALEEESCDWFG